MRTHLAVPALFVLLLPACAAPADQQAATDEAAPASTGIEGVWKITESAGQQDGTDYRITSPQPSLFIFTDGYYSIAYVDGSEPRPLLADSATRLTLTSDETRAIFLPYHSNSGTWALSDEVLTVHPVVALWPNFMAGDSAVLSVAWDNGDLLLTRMEEDVHWNARLQRLR
jgi:hypothetical protein